MGVDWNAVAVADVEGELARVGSALAATLSAGDNLRYLASVTSSGIRVGVCEAPTELAHLSPANSGLLIETRGFGEFPLLLSGRGGGSNAAAEAVLADVVAIAAGTGRD
jgi:homoserine dehydrogenase